MIGWDFGFGFQTVQYVDWISHGVSHTVPFSILIDKLPPFAMWTAFPPSDYYGGSVTMPDFQRHLPWGVNPWNLSPCGITHSPDGLSGLGNLRLDC